MSSSRTASASTLEDRHLANLITILRQANYRYQQIAYNMRQTMTPTQHARLRARDLGLKLNIKAALQLDQKYVSQVPLPVLSSTPLPVSKFAGLEANGDRRLPTIVIPAHNSDRRNGRGAVLATSSRWSPSPVTGPNHSVILEKIRSRREADVPMDVQASTEEEDDANSVYSSTSDESIGPVTPENMMVSTVRIKRKSSEIYVSGKRTKFAVQP
ncbi:hypothetical protein PC9H_004209 [Pleurotus ostreatus]|uniref:Uncharacterized protein n=1 Tax=Pleurotus ostreatus TaxID=5322 RepID=A0A8H7A793_PLEOS|nr:uncharacterized protein PC9H_004209 [Pleurotus ostreatus]KAF7437370.1 hypothetical protein PC9H_004209 [Pleurotus ostreatus]KAJ8703283.1 hypothetical protein PTI98_001918 [Pleurotus ostreatus]